MKLSRMSRLLAAAFALVTVFGGEALAQYTPTLTVTATGNTVTIEWTPITGALGYTLVAGTTPGGSEIATVNLPTSVTRIVVAAPNGTYYLRVRAFAGALTGPFSNEASVSVGLLPCVPGSTPVLSVAVDNQYANVSWTSIPGATSYSVQWSRFSGGTELVEIVSSTSVQRLIPINGTFFVRVVANTNGCGPATSNEAPFTIAVTRRHLSASEIYGHLDATRNAYPQAFFNAHRDGTPERWDFIILACRRLYAASGGTVGCNFRRATIGDLSMDGLSVENPSDGRYYFADVISGAGGSNPVLYYNHTYNDPQMLLRDGSGQYAPWGFANPFGVPGSYGPIRTYVNYGAAGGW